MFCNHCGKTTADNANYCRHCGASLASITPQPMYDNSVNMHASPPEFTQTLTVAQVRPWVRYWARMFDIYVASFLGGLAIAIFYPDALNEEGFDLLFGLSVIFAWIFIESMILSIFGTTPGKWLFKIKLMEANGGGLKFDTALSRSFKVWWRGLGTGFPLISLITLSVAHGKLTKNGITSWDSDGGVSVTHDRIGPLRVIIALIFFFGFLLLVALGSMSNF